MSEHVWVYVAQGLLCGVLQVIIQKLSEQDASKAALIPFADNIMEALLRVFACHSATVHEEAMLAVGALTYACGTQFNKYMERFLPILEKGLTNHQVRTSRKTSPLFRIACSLHWPSRCMVFLRDWHASYNLAENALP